MNNLTAFLLGIPVGVILLLSAFFIYWLKARKDVAKMFSSNMWN